MVRPGSGIGARWMKWFDPDPGSGPGPGPGPGPRALGPGPVRPAGPPGGPALDSPGSRPGSGSNHFIHHEFGVDEMVRRVETGEFPRRVYGWVGAGLEGWGISGWMGKRGVDGKKGEWCV